ncbi:MAG: HIT domain-containing protein [candidate division Zixibacteria bacterium]|nr:HIT domain-containing protein [candidate division Zixibacteria bacterium]MDD5425664.1 HIT domain-containing protein [candidate division Zixibacteria bacterium]
MDDRILWAPWRAAFVLAKKEKGCPFCKAFNQKKDSLKNLMVHRGESCFVVLNKFPYNSGHALIVPNRHIYRLDQLKKDESNEFFYLTRLTVKVIKKTLRPQSFNLGMNLGRCSGAGIPEHLHMHIVPRWNGDTSFMMVLGKTKLVSVPLDYVYDAIREGFEKL